MKDKYPKYLPIGSVVMLENMTKKVMITGFCIKKKLDNEKIYDYIACLYPEGVIDTNKNILFNHDDIKLIYAIGYSDNEEKEFKNRLNQEMEGL